MQAVTLKNKGKEILKFLLMIFLCFLVFSGCSDEASHPVEGDDAVDFPSTILEGHTGHVFSVTFSPDGRTIASGSGNGTIQL